MGTVPPAINREKQEGWLGLPELNVAVFAFLLNLVWEFAQVPLFGGMPLTAHWPAVQVCAQAAIGDVVLALVAFWAVAAGWRSRRWVLRATYPRMVGFVAVGISITVVMEWTATHVLGRWSYAPSMSTVPGLEVGASPLLQWLLLPPLVVWFVRRQLT